MATNYPGALDAFTNPTASDTLNSPSHSAQHANANDAIEAVESVIGTTAGTSVLKDFAAGDFAYRVSAGSVPQQILQDGTINSFTLGTTYLSEGVFADPSGDTMFFVGENNASPVNYVQVLAQATGTAPIVSSTGESNIGLQVKPSGTGRVTVTNLSATGGVNLVESTSNVQAGTANAFRGIYVPCAGMFASTTSGAATRQFETSTNKQNFKVFDFDTSGTAYAEFGLPSPTYWDGSTIYAQFYWFGTVSTGTTVWSVQSVSYSDGDVLDATWGTAVAGTDAVGTTSSERISPETGAMTVAGSPVGGDYVQFRIWRNTGDAQDAMTGTASLKGVRMRFGIDQYSDV